MSKPDHERAVEEKEKTDRAGNSMLPPAYDLWHEVSACTSRYTQRVAFAVVTNFLSLKLGNLFLTDKMELKIGDFGLATKLEFEGDRKRTVCGTPNYIAPEILDGKQGHSYEVDIWSLGVILYTLLIGKPPFETSDVKTTYKRIKANAYTFPEHIIISEHAKDLVSRILNLDPLKRPTMDQILEHKFMSGHSIPKLLPASTLACPPSASYVKQFSSVPLPTTAEKPRLESTVPLKSLSSMKGEEEKKKPIMETLKSALPKAEPVPKKSGGPAVWVKKWVDYSAKYGLGYLMSNGCFGVFFNDSSKIVLHPNEQYRIALTHNSNFDYIEKRPSDKQDVLSSYSLTDYPKDLQKKVTLLQHFRSYLDGDSKGKNDPSSASSDSKSSAKVQPTVYVKKWMRTRHAIMFRLSNKLVQVTFEDKTEIVLSSETREVTYVNKKGERETYPLSSALESTNAEMAKRLKYTKDILTHMLSSAAGAGSNPGKFQSMAAVLTT